MFVSDYMTSNPVTIPPDHNYPQAISVIRKQKIRHLPVIENGRLVGIVVEKDLLSNQPSPATTLSVYEIYSLLEVLRIRQMMSRPVITVEGDCPIEEAARIMVENKVSCLPVMAGETLVGIITETDIFKILVEVLGGGEEGYRMTVYIPDKVGQLASLSGRIAEVGGNIVAVTNTRILKNEKREVTIKTIGIERDTLVALAKDIGGEVRAVYPTIRYQPRLFG